MAAPLPSRPPVPHAAMKLLSRNFSKGGEGSVKMVPEEGNLQPRTPRPPHPAPHPCSAGSTCLACLPACRTRPHQRTRATPHTCVPYTGEDLWHAYNLIREGDHVTANTFRKVMKDTGTGGESERIKLTLTIQVEGVEYDAEGGLVAMRPAGSPGV